MAAILLFFRGHAHDRNFVLMFFQIADKLENYLLLFAVKNQENRSITFVYIADCNFEKNPKCPTKEKCLNQADKMTIFTEIELLLTFLLIFCELVTFFRLKWQKIKILRKYQMTEYIDIALSNLVFFSLNIFLWDNEQSQSNSQSRVNYVEYKMHLHAVKVFIHNIGLYIHYDHRSLYVKVI